MPPKLYRLISLFIILSFSYITYRVYSFDPGIRELHFDILAGSAPAPWQYRLLPHLIANVLADYGIRFYQTFALLDAASLTVALSIFGRFWLPSAPAQSPQRPLWRPLQRSLFLFILIGVVQYWLLWAVYWHQVPYTMPSLLYVACALWLYNRLRNGQTFGPIIGLILCTTLQIFVRADIAFATSVGFALYFLRHHPARSSVTRWRLIAVASLIGLLALGGQAYLTLQLFPDSAYNIAIVQLFHNVSPVRLVPFLLYMAVYGMAVEGWRNRPQTPPDLPTALLYASALHLLMWVTVGIIDETRIFLPLSLPLAHYAAHALLARLNITPE